MKAVGDLKLFRMHLCSILRKIVSQRTVTNSLPGGTLIYAPNALTRFA